ncbi:hypothetical protein [Iodobacter fluviatilis]|uniref:Uncharacterized protein n=1 Tax=Iodobacter fluviatilis TaxID=537 RepID=A0A7G3GAM5_9NEIS|nr:hypothetical protein [Iodobacter fluviatilis]QBC44427.1 hypothetical protein C1H71_13410 [Iodobacter fluviatilis]
MKKPKACTNGPRHKWKFVKDIAVKKMSGCANGFSTLSITAKGVYSCECGAKKCGNPHGGIQ